MKQEDIIRMAREAGLEEMWELTPRFVERLERFAALVAAAATEAANARATSSWMLMCKKMVAFENEACAVVAETPISGEQDDITMQAKDRVAAAIRARGQA
jgi:hypothetical protein